MSPAATCDTKESMVNDLSKRLRLFVQEFRKSALEPNPPPAILIQCSDAVFAVPRTVASHLGHTMVAFLSRWSVSAENGVEHFNFSSFSLSQLANYVFVVIGAGKVTSANCMSTLKLASLLNYEGRASDPLSVSSTGTMDELSELIGECLSWLPTTEADWYYIVDTCYKYGDCISSHCQVLAHDVSAAAILNEFKWAAAFLSNEKIPLTLVSDELMCYTFSVIADLCESGKLR